MPYVGLTRTLGKPAFAGGSGATVADIRHAAGCASGWICNPRGPSGRGERQGRDHGRRARRKDRHGGSVRDEVAVEIPERDGAAESW
jgi:hypothetical protein